MSAIHLAAKHGRIAVLDRLLELGVAVDLPNSDGLTPQCLAAEAGHAEAIRRLHGAGAEINDCSLHLSCRRPDVECISVLIGVGHDTLWPSDMLDGRVPLAELCQAAKGSGFTWEKTIEKAMQQLVPFPDHTWRVDGKTVLHLAIDNRSAAVPLVRAFLRVAQLWRNPSRDDDYLYTDTQSELRYSPTKHVEHRCPGSLVRRRPL